MGNSLFDQLKNSGLVDEKKAKQVKKEKHKQARQKKSKQVRQVNGGRLREQQARAEKAARDRELNRQHNQAAEQKAIAAQIKQLIEMNRIEDSHGELGFNFVDGKQVQRIYITEKLRDQLVQGSLAIVKLEGSYNLVPARVAEKIKLREPSCVMLCNVPRSQVSDAEDPYADYQVPDDLTW